MNGISLLVPYRGDNGGPRDRNWEWCKRYWEDALPGAEVIEGDDGGEVFSRSGSINAAAAKATGDVLVNMDADQIVPASAVLIAANEIRRQHNWFVLAPRVVKLRRRAASRLVSQPAAYPLLPERAVEVAQNDQLTLCAYPRAAFDAVGGMDEAFRGWGGEDVAWACALDLLWAPHKTLTNEAVHLWHPHINSGGLIARHRMHARTVGRAYDWRNPINWARWEGQEVAGAGVDRQAVYMQAAADRDHEAMTHLAAGAPLRMDTGTDLHLRLGLPPVNLSFSVAQRASRQERRYGFSRPSSILHCPRAQRHGVLPWVAVVGQYLADEAVGPCHDVPELQFVTYNTRGKPGALELSLAHLGLRPPTVLGTHLSDRQWNWGQKVRVLDAYLKSGDCTTEYVACVDDDDMLVFDEPALIVEKFQAADCQMLFCRGGGSKPYDWRVWDFEQRTYAGYPNAKMRHLNANFIGRREYTAARVDELAAGIANPAWVDDQLAWRRMHALHYPLIKVDVQASVFTEFDTR
jgi:hypothetical protein